MMPTKDKTAVVTSGQAPWHVLIPLGLGTGLSLLGDAGLYAVLPTHAADAGVMVVSVGVLLSVNRFIRLISNGWVGWLLDRFPRRRIFVPALFLGALSTGVYALTRGFWPLLVARLIWGISWSGIWVAGNAIVFDIASDENRGRWVGLYHVSFFSGAAAGALSGGAFTDWLGFHAAMGIAAILTFIGAIVALIFLPETRGKHVPRSSAFRRKGKPKEDSHRAARRPELTSAIALHGVNRIVVAGFLTSTFGLFLSEVLGEAITIGSREVGVATLTGLGLGLSTLISMLFTPMVGGLSDWIGDRWRVAAVGLAVGMGGFTLLALGIPVAILFGLPMSFYASSSNQGLATALLGDITVGSGRRGRSLGVLYTVGDLASAVGPPIAYGLIPIWGARNTYWLGVGLFGLMFVVAVRWSVLARNRPSHSHNRP